LPTRLEKSACFYYHGKDWYKFARRFTMADATAKPASPSQPPWLGELQTTLEREIPMCAQMGIRVHDGGAGGLVMQLPLGPNRNHQQTAFAGSLNALCTIAGWGSVYLLLRELGRGGSIVIRRSTIKYQEPVTSSEIYARCLPVTAEAKQYFLEMLDDKGQAKLDLVVEVAGAGGPAVMFTGSYVVLPARAAETIVAAC
jgi:thioesterase domain-containing protein